MVFMFVVGVDVIDIKTTDIAFDLHDTVIAPVMVGITDGVVMGAWISPVVAKPIELFVCDGIQVLYETKLSLTDVVSRFDVEVSHWLLQET